MTRGAGVEGSLEVEELEEGTGGLVRAASRVVMARHGGNRGRGQTTGMM